MSPRNSHTQRYNIRTMADFIRRALRLVHRGQGHAVCHRPSLSGDINPEKFQNCLRLSSDHRRSTDIATTTIGRLNKQRSRRLGDDVDNGGACLNKEIAWFRGSSEGTIKTHQQAILRRLGLRTRTHAAVQYGIHCDRMRDEGDSSAIVS